ncbi:MAG TPA: bifunctional acyl-ACP--phospholipid O-acyltransferase/long-chain-fatty-acid--ACP ligase [Rhodocyclaceae bacterium]|jgi:acyl-[acyl-carrier-protein]-phospholipid O-acyltransferase/long-chain-fatty-acid--[acyl-carrier-protein] ligase|nr:bifunctional acyl-ACP--phospholipid O-acyltransferase/long-chain-fatty-acid--ACP ligase [Rhodocyclaceae bacterium]HNL20569.1 bifunctional acyl-ACP--phospholipid O-acyltransferase/long-chain-fatty-acid--ACP ligase [Rhodocyclaceae bacterium]HNM81268.1 bifunctional acyl-ACP--phospholipid O-acyltransferase/long-chain-fatty-acid--ACP ligase [Rhodocyclaceae bacterium]HNP05588.1 bifunctional acyl-ACP--phospholipid O-acyltransferase/long-chain-fatty-acid--ACP ligase [Rhodocyclaceae bacterium]
MRSLIKPFLRGLCRILFRVRVEGLTRDIESDRLLVVANHESFLDGLLLGLFLPIDPVFVVHTGVANDWFFRLLLSQVDYLAVDPTSPMAMKKVIRLLETGRPVVIFPEGRITTTGSLMKVYDGPAFVAAKTGAKVLPVRLDGPSRSYFSRVSGKHPRVFFPKVRVSILPSTTIPMPDAPSAKLRRRRAGEAMRRLMQEMIFASRPQQTLFSALCDAADVFGKKRRVLEDMKQIEYSYNDLLKMALMLSRLVERHTAGNERVGLLLPNLAPTLGLLIGLTARRRVPAMLNYTAGVDAMQAACTAAEVRTIVTSRAFVEQAKLADKLAALAGIELLYLEDLRESIGLGDKLWLMAWAIHRPRAFELPTSPEEAAVVLFTSGSEGKPKGVVLPHRAILANIAQVRAVIDFSVDDKVLNALPVFHSFGLTAGALLPVLTGAGLFLYPTPLHYRIIPELAYDRNCTVLFGTSTFLGNYARFAHPYDFYRLRYVVAGAEKLSEAVRNTWFEKFGIRIFEGYGATETAPVLAVNTPMAYRTGTVGNLLPGIEAKLLPVPGIERGGILHVRGPNVMAGYLKADAPGVLQPPVSEAGAGWYETGDVVEFDEEGFVKIVGRVKRFAKIAGEMVSLEVVEKLAVAASPSQAHAASSQPDAAKGEALVLFTTDGELSRDLLAAKARELGIPELAVPRKIHKVDGLPLLGTGKVDYVTLKRLAEAV